MASQQQFEKMERGFWTEGAGYYRMHVAQQCVLSFPGMAGVYSNEDVASQTGGNRWHDAEMTVKGFLKPSGDTAILTYEATGTRNDIEKYRALVSTVYALHRGEWKLVFHQQTPLSGD